MRKPDMNYQIHVVPPLVNNDLGRLALSGSAVLKGFIPPTEVARER
jgi:hypothetical protein